MTVIIPEKRPKFAYKYCSAARCMQILKDRKLFFPKATSLNDLYEFRVAGLWKEDPDSRYRMFAKRATGHGVEYEEALEAAKNMDEAQLQREYEQALDDLRAPLQEIIDHSGVTCFSSAENNQRLWGTYGASHTGACLEFDVSSGRWPLADELKPVIYVDELLPICPSRLIGTAGGPGMFKFDLEPLKMLLCSKHLDWKEEQEWRLLMLAMDDEAAGARTVGLKGEFITHVFLGPRISDEDENAIHHVAASFEPPLTVLKRTPIADRFGEFLVGAEHIRSYDQIQYWNERQERHSRARVSSDELHDGQLPKP